MDDQFYRQNPHGSARFLQAHELGSSGDGFGPIARVGDALARFQAQEPSIIFGGAGSGKFANLGGYQLAHPSTGSFLALDMGAQMASTSWHWNLAAGRQAYQFNPFRIGAYADIHHDLNLFAILKDDDELFDNAEEVAELGIPETQKKGDNAWVEDDSRRWVSTLLMMIVLLEGSVTPKRLAKLVHELDTDNEALKQWGRASEGLPYDIYSTIVEIFTKKHDAPKEYSAVMSHIKTSLRFLSSPRIADSVSGSVDYLSLLAEPDQNVGVYLVLPSGKGKQCKSLIRWIFGIAAMHLARRGLGARPLVYIEEAATMGGASFIKTLVSEMRKYARVVLVYQSPGQVALHFGQHGAQEIFESCGTKIYLGGGIRTVETAKTVAESIGKTSIDVEDKMAEADRQYRAQRAQFDAMLNGQDLLLAEQIYSHELDQASNRKKVGRYALDPAELMRLNNEVVVLRSGAGAVLGQKMPGYWINTAMAGRFGPDPLFPPIDRVTFHRLFWGTTTRAFVRESAPAEFADWPNHSNGQVAYAKGYKTWGKPPLFRRWFGL